MWRVIKLGAIVFLLFAGAVSVAQPLNVFEVYSSNGVIEEQAQVGAIVGRVKYNSVIKNIITEQSVLILGLDFLNERIEFDVISLNKTDSTISYSAIASNHAGILTISESNGVMLGSLTYHNKLYKFKPSGDGDTLVIEIHDEQFDEQVQNSVAFASSDIRLGRRARVAALGGPDDGSKVDVIIAYTPEFIEDVGGEENVAAYLEQLRQETNLSFQLSGVNTSVDIVHSYPTRYHDSTNARQDANYFLTGSGEGQELREKREVFYADIMIVLTGNNGYDVCGYSPMLEANEANALSVIREDCGTGYFQFAHEIGHIFGADHNLEEASGLGAEDAHGYCGNGWRSIMAYRCSTGGGKRLPLWSNPDEMFNGEAMGVAGVSNNVRVLNDRALEVANFRFAPAVPDKVSLRSPVGIIVTDTTPAYEWQSVARVDVYHLKVTDNSGVVLMDESYTPDQANCASGVCSVTPVTELPFGLIDWWVTPENVTGKGPESEKGIFAVAPIPILPDAATLIAPEGIVSDTMPTYQWNAVSIASWYKLEVTDAGGQLIVNKWYKAVDAHCQSGSGECFVRPETLITQNPVTWRVQTWNHAGYGEWSEARTFYVYPLP